MNNKRSAWVAVATLVALGAINATGTEQAGLNHTPTTTAGLVTDDMSQPLATAHDAAPQGTPPVASSASDSTSPEPLAGQEPTTIHGPATTQTEAVSALSDCVDPHPCETHWPDGLNGPFALKGGEPLYVEVEVPRDWDDNANGSVPADLHGHLSETIRLAGWIGLPDVPEDVTVPVVLSSSPYLGQGGSQYDPDDPEWWHEDARGLRVDNHWGMPPIELVKRGYAAAFFSVRGTGESGGCVDWFGPDEQKDQAAIVEWLAAQPWSNGRVAMGGRSYMAGTAFEAAIEQAPSLKTIVVGGLVTDLYTLLHSPQGAAGMQGLVHDAGFPTVEALGNHQHPDLADVTDRGCLDAEEPIGWTVRGYATEERPADFYAARRLIDRFADVRASVLLTHGLRDVGHDFQDDAAWGALTNAPKRALLGYWGHELPAIWVQFDPSWQHHTWEAILFNWLDYWLKGLGVPERLGKFDYQAGAEIPWWVSHVANNAPQFDPGSWIQDSSWPPRRAGEEVLYLTGSDLRSDTAPGDRTFRSAPTILSSFRAAEYSDVPMPLWRALCPDGIPDGFAGVAYLSEQASRDLLIAGNPFAYLRLSSDQPGGLVGVHLLTVPADVPCDLALNPPEAHVLAFGVADLRFHAGNLSGTDLSEGQHNVRIDLGSVSEQIPAGRRLAVVVSYGEGDLDLYMPSGQHAPTITVHADGGSEASHVVIPFVGRGLGSKRPTLDYPQRPFVP